MFTEEQMLSCRYHRCVKLLMLNDVAQKSHLCLLRKEMIPQYSSTLLIVLYILKVFSELHEFYLGWV
jgi:hypothetical protein